MSKAVSANKTPEDLIKYHQEQMSACEMSFVENAYEAGKILNEQKTKLAHGKFSDWCKEHWHKSRRTATDYMLLAENLKPTQISSCVSIAQAKKLLPSKSASVADLPSKPAAKGRPMPGGKSPKGVHQREPGDESEPDGADPVVEAPNDDWKLARSKAMKTAQALQRAIDDLNEIRPNSKSEGLVEDAQAIEAQLRGWR